MDEQALYESRLELVDFLIEALHDVPDAEFVETLLSGDILLPEGDVNDPLDRGFDELRTFIDEHQEYDLDVVQEALEREYTRVFVGPRPPVVAHETYYRENTDYLGEGLAEVEASYGAAGWAPPEEYPEEHDFVAVALALLAVGTVGIIAEIKGTWHWAIHLESTVSYIGVFVAAVLALLIPTAALLLVGRVIVDE